VIGPDTSHPAYGPGDRDGFTLITGVTGLIGNVLLAELLKSGHRCVVLMRPPVGDRMDRLIGLLEAQGIDGRAYEAGGELWCIEGSLPEALPESPGFPIRRVVHIAASTRFCPDQSGDPARTNGDGTRRLLRWMDRQGISEIHHVSTAYVSGETDRPAPERVASEPPRFRNVYEQSKWQAERHIVDWGEMPGRSWTIYRPSIVVGDWHSGRAARFAGAYQAFRAFESLCQSDRADPGQPIALRIESPPDGNINLIPVDYLAELMGAIINHPDRHGRVYNIVHPEALSTRSFLDMILRYFGMSGVQLAEPGSVNRDNRTAIERGFHATTRHISPYLRQVTRFERTNTAQAEALLTHTCPDWDEDAIHRLIEYARRQDWGRHA